MLHEDGLDPSSPPPSTTTVCHRFCKSTPPTCSSWPPLPCCLPSFPRRSSELDEKGLKPLGSLLPDLLRWMVAVSRYVVPRHSSHLLTVGIHRRNHRSPATVKAEWVLSSPFIFPFSVAGI
ncbi:hypothetical protein GQ457_15G016950 [Hibiscus cannabinus]